MFRTKGIIKYMEKIQAPFTDEEYEMIRYSFKQVANKHGVDAAYPRKIASGVFPCNSNQAKSILKSLQQILHVLKPIPTENV